jgi:hypothetical protein
MRPFAQTREFSFFEPGNDWFPILVIRSWEARPVTVTHPFITDSPVSE